MTIPKFRVYDKVKKHMSEVEAIVYTENKVYPFYSKTVRRYIPFKECVLMQSTGVIDENGKEIFEGDIVQAERYFGGFNNFEMFKGVVKQLEGAWMIVTDNNAVPVFSEIEENIVIGNIYENPELLEER